mgnify:CR=1 FL=1
MSKRISTGIYRYDKHFCNNKVKKKLFGLMTDHERVGELIRDGSRILDFGCGDCSFFDSLKNRRLDLVGYDLDERYTEIGKKKGYKIFNSLNEVTGEFDYVVANQVVEHMDLDLLNEFFQKGFDLLKKDGILIISTLNARELYVVRDIWDDPTHVRPYSSRALERAGKEFNFSLVKVMKHHMRMNPLKLFLNVVFGFSIYSGITLVFKKT